MSVQLPFKKDNSEYNKHESSELPKMSERLTDSNILQSKRTYGKKLTDKILSMSSESNNYFSPFVEDLFAEENSESTTYNRNNNDQKGIDSTFSLFNYDGIDYYSSVSTDNSKIHSSLLSLRESSSSASNYQRTRKNLRNRLSNQQYISDEISVPVFQEENLNCKADIDESKSASNLSEQIFSAKQNFHVSITNQSNDTKSNGVKSSDACINKLSQNSSILQMAKQTEKISNNGTVFKKPVKNSLVNTNFFSIVDLVNRFSASNDQARSKNNSSYKRKGTKDCESTPAGKKSVIKNVTSSKLKSFNKKTLNSTVSAEKSKNVISKSNKMKSQIPNTKINSDVKKNVVKTPSKSVRKKNNRSIENAERSEAMDYVNNLDALENDAKVISNSVKKEHNKLVNSIEKSVNKLDALRKGGDKIPLKTVKRNNDDTEKSVKRSKKYASKNKLVQKNATTKVKHQSSSCQTSDLDLVRSGTTEKIWSNDGDKRIEKSLTLLDENLIHPAFNSISNINVGSNFFPTMPMVIAPLPPTSLEGDWEVAPLCLWKTVPSVIDSHSIQNDNQVDFDDIAIPGPSALSNDLSSNMNASEYDMENEPSDNNNQAYNGTTICKIENTITETTICSNESKSKYSPSPRPFISSRYVLDQYMASHFQKVRKNCILNFKEYSSKILQMPYMNTNLLNMSVSEVCFIPKATDTLWEYLQIFVLANPESALFRGEGYEFPENFETENFLRMVKDFVHTTSSYIIPKNAPLPWNIPYVNILKAAKQNMSIREFAILMAVFGCAESSIKLTEMLSKLSLVGMLVIFCEFKCRQIPLYER